MSPHVERPQPPYLQITEHYRGLIRSGELRDGDRLPSARKLAEQWHVAHATAAKVLATLRAEGLVTTVQGGAGGTIVRVREVGTAPRDRMLAVRRVGKIYPSDMYARIVSADLVAAPGYVAEALGVAAGAAVIRRRRITYREDAPVSRSTSWFVGALADVAPALLAAERIKQGTPGYIERQTGRSMAHGRDQVTAGAADAEMAADLGIVAGDPVLVGRNWVRDSEGDVIEFGESVAVAGRWSTYDYEVS